MEGFIAAAPVPVQPSAGRAIVAATVGNMLEWYDFTIYAAFAVQISRAFFPAGNELTSLMFGFITFGIGFIARPFGAAMLGAYADRHGRGAALSLTILLMALGTGMIALCPTYASIGPVAPIIVVVARLIQGFSAGGEIGSAVSVLVENAPAERRGFYASFQQLAQGGATMLSGLVALMIALALTPEEVGAWGWRIAFLGGLLIAPVGIYIRRTLADGPLFQASQASRAIDPARAEHTARTVFTRHWRPVLIGMMVVMLWTVAQYITNYMPTFASRELKMSLSNSYFGPFVTGIVLLFCPLVGTLADRFNRKKVMLVGAIGLFCVAYPAFSYLVAHPDLPSLVLVQVSIAVFMLIYTAPASAVLAELFPTSVRATGIALTYSLGVAIFGGFTPANITALISWTGTPVSTAYYLMGAAAVSFVTVLLVTDHTGEELT